MINKNIKVLLPIFGLEIFNFSEPVSSIDLKITDELRFVSLNPKISFSKNLPISKIKIGKDEIFIINNGMPEFSDEFIDADYGLILKYSNPDEDMVVLRPHFFEPLAKNFLTLLRLFCNGDVYIPTIFFENYSYFTVTNEYLIQNSLIKRMVLDFSKIELFIQYLNKQRAYILKIDKLSKEQNNLLKNALHRFNLAIHFFNKTYFFVQDDYSMYPDAKKGNIDRLINLICALEAMFMHGDYEKDIITGLNCLHRYKKYDSLVREYYKLRSDYIHANPDKLVAIISDEKINKLKEVVRHAILSYITLLSTDKLFAQKENYLAYNKNFPKIIQVMFNSDREYYLNLIESDLNYLPAYF